jgi:hypothetical protein
VGRSRAPRPNDRQAVLTMHVTYAVNLVPPTSIPSADDLFDLAFC